MLIIIENYNSKQEYKKKKKERPRRRTQANKPCLSPIQT